MIILAPQINILINPTIKLNFRIIDRFKIIMKLLIWNYFLWMNQLVKNIYNQHTKISINPSKKNQINKKSINNILINLMKNFHNPPVIFTKFQIIDKI